MLEEKFPSRLAWAREAGGMSQSDLARRITPQSKPQSVQQWEAGVTTPRRNRLKGLSRVLGVRERWLSFGELPVRDGDIVLPAPAMGAPPSPGNWRAAVRDRLPDALRQFADRSPLPGYPLLFASTSTLADIATADVTQSQAALWRLATLARLFGAANPRLRAVLYVPDGTPVAQLQWEAHPAGLLVVQASNPAAVASDIAKHE
jgi:hypothetical protein